MILLRSGTRILALVGKELVESVRRPRTFLSLIIGPFLVLVVFGLGYRGIWAPVRAEVVVPPGSGLPTDAQSYQGVPGLEVDGVTPDRATAESELRTRGCDAVIVFPPDLQANLRAGQQSTINVEVDTADPNRLTLARTLATQLSDRVNQAIVSRSVAAGQQASGQQGIPPNVVAQPTQAYVTDLAPVSTTVVMFFAPAVFALILQHLCITLVALSLIRERTTGLLEIYRVGPTSAWEIIVAKLIAFVVIGVTVAGLLMALLVFGLHVPLLGPSLTIIEIVLALLAASIGIGLLIAVISDSERTAVQASLILLLVTIFFSGFVIDLELFAPPVRVLGALLPVTHAIGLLRDVMLFGLAGDPSSIAAIAGIAAATIAASWLLLRRSMAAIA